MISDEGVRKNRRQFLSLTGMEVAVFDALHEVYAKQWEAYVAQYTVAGEERTRAHRPRKDGVPERTEDRLLFVLHYLKSNDIQEHHAARYGFIPCQV